MSSSIHAAPSSACIASTSPASRQQKRIDFLTGYCGFSPPTLFKRIGIMAADGQLLSTRFHAARQKRTTRLRRARRLELAQHTGNPFPGPEVSAGLPVKTTPASIAFGPAQRADNRIRMRIARPFSRSIDKAAVRLSGRVRPCARHASSNHHSRREPMTARAGPFVR